jgi:hypothetical protein
MNETSSRPQSPNFRLRTSLILVAAGLALYILGVRPSLFGADLSPVVGFVQIAVFLIGLALMCLGGVVTMNILWQELLPGESEKSIAADIGYRLVSTGYVISFVSAMADAFGFGSQPLPNVPYFGQWQAIGVMVGELVIAFGLFLMIPKPKSS